MAPLPSPRFQRRAWYLAGLLISAPALWPATVLAQPTRTGAPVTLNFAQADIEAVARAMASITGRTVVVDPRVKGTITLTTDTPVTPAAAYNQFLTALRLQGYTVVQSADIDKVVPEADAKLQTDVVNAGPVAGGGANQIQTQIFKLNFENANNLVPVLRPLISPNNTINANPGTNALVITDYADNLRRLARVIAAMDVSNATDVEVFPLRYAIASDLAPLISRLIEPGTSTGGAAPAAGQSADSSYRTTLLAEPRSNALIVRAANPARMNMVRALVTQLDVAPATDAATASNAAAGNIHVVYLKNADAAQLAITLRAAMAANPGFAASSGSSSGAAGSAGGSTTGGGLTSIGTASTSSSTTTSSSTSSGSSSTGAASSNLLSGAQQPNVGGQIQADPANNALIISAPEPQYRQLRAVIDQLDIRRAQIYIEALIAEISADDTGSLGVQWLGLAGGSRGGVAGGTNYGTTGNLWTNAVLAKAGSYSSMTFNQGLNVGFYAGSLGMLVNALATQTKANILSTPTLLTLDNQEAKITIGKNVPVATGSYTTTSSGSSNPYTTYERMDVGLTLNIKPQISADGNIKLQIFQEASSISGSLSSSETTSSTNLVTNKRTIASTVLVQDGSTAVLGGLISDQLDISVSSVPVLGSLPLIGPLFRSESRSRSKTNLMVFLRPVVLRDNQSMEQLAMDRYDMIHAQQLQEKPQPSTAIPINDVPLVRPEPNGTPLSKGGAVQLPLVELQQPEAANKAEGKPADKPAGTAGGDEKKE